MKTLRTTIAVALLGLALTAFQSSALAQTRRDGAGSGPTRSTSTSRSSNTASQSSKKNTSAVKSSEAKQVSRTSTKPSTSVGAPSKPKVQTPVTRPSTVGNVARPSSGSQTKPSADNKMTRPSSGSQVTRSSSSSQVTRPTPKPSTPQTKPQKPAGNTRPADVTKPADNIRPADKPSTVTRPGHRPGDRKPADKKPGDRKPDDRRPGDKKPGGPDVRPGKPVQVRPDHRPDPHRLHPRDHDFMHYSKPSYYWTAHNHCYGYRVRTLPSYAHRHVYYGVTYYCYNDIWYRPYGGYYIVCRPPFGTVLAASIISDMAWAAINFSYYNTVAQTYNQINENYEYIAEQNAVIAQNNAIIAAQNEMIVAGHQQASEASALAIQLGLVQSYAAAGSTYYYQDGVFYTMDANGQYTVIVPPAGALVETLPEDYDIVVLADGNEYYKVDDTIYRVTIVEGKPYFEVLGQLIG